MNMSKFDESFIIMGDLNIKQVIKLLKEKYSIKFEKSEIDYYVMNLKVDKMQKNIMFNLFGKYFGNIRDMYSLNLKDYAKLVVIMKRMLERHGFVIMQHILSGIVNANPHIKKMTKKQLQKNTNSDRFSYIQEKYKSTFDIINKDNSLFNNMNNLISSTILLVDFDNSDKTFRRLDLDGNQDLIDDEYMRLIEMI